MFKDDYETFKASLPIGFTSKKRTGVFRMDVNMRSCRDCAHLTSTLNRNMFLINPKTIVANVKPVKKDKAEFFSLLVGKKSMHKFMNRQIKNSFSYYLHKYPGRSQYPAVL